jgi:ribosomal protein L39E
VHHITIDIEVFSPAITRQKPVQFWLCDACNRIMSVNLARDKDQKVRVAKLLTYKEKRDAPDWYGLKTKDSKE